MNRNRNTQVGPHALTQMEPEPNAAAQEPELSDPTALPPTNGSTLSEALANDAEPSLAASGDSHSAVATPLGIPAPQAILSPLEERLRRLEDALAQVPDPRQIETRIAERVAERLTEQRSIPVAQVAPAQSAGLFSNVGKRLLNSTAEIAKAAAGPERHESSLLGGMRRTYLFFETLTELRAMWCMYTDPRYRMSWVGRLVPLGLALFILVSAFLVPGAQLVVAGTFIDKIADVIPAYILFKLLTYEARRYRETAPDLPPDLRL